MLTCWICISPFECPVIWLVQYQHTPMSSVVHECSKGALIFFCVKWTQHTVYVCNIRGCCTAQHTLAHMHTQRKHICLISVFSLYLYLHVTLASITCLFLCLCVSLSEGSEVTFTVFAKATYMVRDLCNFHFCVCVFVCVFSLNPEWQQRQGNEQWTKDSLDEKWAVLHVCMHMHSFPNTSLCAFAEFTRIKLHILRSSSSVNNTNRWKTHLLGAEELPWRNILFLWAVCLPV